MNWYELNGIIATDYGVFLPSHVLDKPVERAKVHAVFNFARWPDFTFDELRSKGNGDLRVHYGTLDALQRLRDRLKRPVAVSSYYRDPDYNRKVGGAETSYHLLGMAVDTPTYNSKVGQYSLIYHATQCGFKSFGIYPTFTHLDLGPHRVWLEGQPDADGNVDPEV